MIFVSFDSETRSTVDLRATGVDTYAKPRSIARIDFETRAVVNLKTAGADKYAADKHTSVWCLAWALDDEPVQIWFPGGPDPQRLLYHIAAGGTVTAWNAPFEIAIFRRCVPRILPHWPVPAIEQFDCTMARALARALPGKLDECAKAFGLPVQKDMVGNRLMLKMCVPTKAWRDNPVGEPQWHDVPADLERLGEYCKQDVEVERQLSKRIAPLTASERKIWLLDRTINDRGVRVDVPKVKAALEIVDKEKRRLTHELKQITAGQVTTANSVPQMLRWLKTRGIELPDLKKRKLSRFLRSEIKIPDDVRRVLQIRLEIAKASNAKLSAMLNGRDEDDRCRGLFGYHIATTGRFGGRRLQLHNFPRPEGWFGDDEVGQKEIEQCLELLLDAYGSDLIRICYADPIPAVSSCLRGLIIPDKGKKFVGGDFSSIENRMLMWLADEQWMLDAFRAFDRGEGVDNYKLAYSRAFNIPVSNVTKGQRLIGKVSVLASGFAGAVGAWLGMSDNYEVIPGDVARAVREVTPAHVWSDVIERFPEDEKWQFGLDPDTWAGIRIVVDAWRAAHPKTTQFWWDLVDAATSAVEDFGRVYEVGKVKFVANQYFLFCQLPSGRHLAYAKPRIIQDDETGRRELWYMGQGKKSKRFERRRLTAAILSENVTSGSARDGLTDAMIRLEERRYPIVLHCHDEAVAEVDHNFGDPQEFRAIMCDSRPWLAGCPIAAEPWQGGCYRK